MINHGQAVKAAAPESLVVVDMPKGSYEQDAVVALYNARKLLGATRADAVKLEGGVKIAATLKLLRQEGISVIGHIGLLPQEISHNANYSVRGKTELEQQIIADDLALLLELGIEVIVIECVYKDFADSLIATNPNALFIGIGASCQCDGQILVIDDILGLTHSIKPPKFVKAYLDGAALFEQAIASFSNDVRKCKFPAEANLYRRSHGKI
jgi:3-methyl-2-oxobutanoate hydroxymethyltransferase